MNTPENAQPAAGPAARLTLPANLDSIVEAALAAGGTVETLCRYRYRDRLYGTDSDAAVDWVAFFPAPPVAGGPADVVAEDSWDDERDHWTLTPRQAAAISIQSGVLIDMFLDDAGGFVDEVVDFTQDSMLGAKLPRLARPFLADPRWVVRFLHTFHLIGARVDAGLVPHPRSTAEEMALHIVLAWARDLHSDGVLEDAHPQFAALSEHPDDLDYSRLREILFEDEDVLFLFDPAFDGIEDSDLGRHLGVANLHPRDWFLPFRDQETTQELVAD